MILCHTSASNRSLGKDPYKLHANMHKTIDVLILQVSYKGHPLLNTHLLHNKVNTLCHDKAFSNSYHFCFARVYKSGTTGDRSTSIGSYKQLLNPID